MGIQEIINLFVNPHNTIKETIEVIDKSGRGIALITNENKKLLGIVTDGDIRRAIIKDIPLSNNVCQIMNKNFTFVTKDFTSVLIENLFEIKPIKQIPVLDDNMTVIDVVFYHEFYSKPVKENYVLIMAGGMGTRLRPLTYDIPKPMLKVGAKPILETIIDQLKSYGFINILISVNYKSEIIKNYFQDGVNFGVNINYIEEQNRMGTGGAIKLAEKYLNNHFFVINGDILTKLNFESLMENHMQSNNSITVATRKYELQIPYGVIEIEGNRVINLKEKPSYSYFVNGGIYCLSPEVFKYIPYNEFYNITELIDNLIENKLNVGSFPIREYWMDIGHMNDYHQANQDYYELFTDETCVTKE
jgi:dTDP-glucose pyrophosphorylase